MTSQVDVRAIQTIDDLSAALARFSGAAGKSLAAVQSEIKRTQEHLQQRLEYWQREVQRREQELACAQRALAACQNAVRRDYGRSCVAEQVAVEWIRRALAEARRELEMVQLWTRRVDEAVQQYQRVAGRLQNLSTDRTGQARAMLTRKSMQLVRYATKGAIFCRALDTQDRPTGVKAIIDKHSIGKGSLAVSKIRPPGFGGREASHHRGHLLAKELGGSGTDPRNIATMYSKTNQPPMRVWEGRARHLAEQGHLVFYEVTPIYAGKEPIAKGFTISIFSDGAPFMSGTVLNLGKPNW